MKRILCVHPDAGVLEAHRRTLLERAREWEVRLERTTATGVAAFQSWRPDAVLAAIAPPDVDGVALLMQVRDEEPETIRIALGDDAPNDATLRSLRIAHRVLPGSVPPGELSEAVRRALLLRDLVAGPELRRLLGDVGPLPAVPRVYSELTRRLADPSVSVIELAELVSEDPALAAQVLRMANSAFFGRDRAVSGLADAAARLGTRLLRSLVLHAELYGGFPLPPAEVGRIEAFQRHSALVARIASGLEPRAPWLDDAFSAGLLHDLGKLVLLSRLPKRYEAIEAEALRSGRELHVVEAEQLGAHHGTIGACLLGMWGLPSVILEAVHGHHGMPVEATPRLDAVRAVALADRLAHDVTDPDDVRKRRPALPLALVTDPRWGWWREMAEQLAEECSTV